MRPHTNVLTDEIIGLMRQIASADDLAVRDLIERDMWNGHIIRNLIVGHDLRSAVPCPSIGGAVVNCRSKRLNNSSPVPERNVSRPISGCAGRQRQKMS